MSIPVRSPFRSWPIAIALFVITTLSLGIGQGRLFPSAIFLGWSTVLLVQGVVWILDRRAAKQKDEAGAMIRLASTPFRLILLLGVAVFVVLKIEMNFVAFLTSMVVGNLFYLATEIAILIRENP